MPPHVYLKAQEERNKEDIAKTRGNEEEKDEQEPQVERVLPKKLPF